MKRLFKVSLMLLVIFLLSGCQNKYLKEINYDEYKELIENKETFILEVMSTDCSACKNFKPKLKEVTEEYKVEVKYINLDKLSEEDYKNLFTETGISGTPTIIFYQEGIEETKASRINGSVSKDKIISKFKANNIIK